MSVAAESFAGAMSFGYRDRGGALQQVRSTIAVGWCLAVGLTIALFQNPLVLVAVGVATALMSVHCRVWREVLTLVALFAPLAVVIALINPIVSQQGQTVLVAQLPLPVFGSIDITRESLVYGAILGLRSLAVFAVCALYVATVDPDELLSVLRRFSVRSAITASMAVRFVPVLARDGANMALARQCRPGEPVKARSFARAVFARSLERSSDAALALETRGFALARPLRVQPPRRRVADWVVIASASVTAILCVLGSVLDLAYFDGFPTTLVEAAPVDMAFAFALFVALSAPLVIRRKGSK